MFKRIALLVFISFLMVGGLVVFADPDELAGVLGSADLMMVLLSMASYTLAIVVFALIWHLLLAVAGLRLGLLNNLRLVFSSVFFNVVTPTASYGGEAVRAYLLNKKFSFDTGLSVSTIVAHRIIGTMSNSLGTLVLGMYLITFYDVPSYLIVIILLVSFSSFFGFVIFLYLGLRLDWSKTFIDRVFGFVARFRPLDPNTKSNVYHSLESYNAGLKVLIKSVWTLIFSILLGLTAWFFVNLVALFSFMALGGLLNAENAFIIFTFFSVARLIPTGLPEFVGSKEAVLAALYSASGLPASTSIAVIFLIRVATQIWMIIFGGLITLQLGIEGFTKKE